MKQILLSTILGGFAMFVFGAVFWMNPLPMNAFVDPKDDVAVQESLQVNMEKTGTYFVPGVHQERAVHEEKAKTGPVALVHYVREGMGPYAMGKMMGLGLVQQFLSALILTLLMKSVLSSLTTYGARVRFSVVVGLIAAVFIDGGNMIWWFQSLAFTLFTGLFHVLAFTIAGLVIARFIRPEIETGDVSAS